MEESIRKCLLAALNTVEYRGRNLKCIVPAVFYSKLIEKRVSCYLVGQRFSANSRYYFSSYLGFDLPLTEVDNLILSNVSKGVFTWYRRRDFHSGARWKVAPCLLGCESYSAVKLMKLQWIWNEQSYRVYMTPEWIFVRGENLAPAQEPGWTRAGMTRTGMTFCGGIWCKRIQSRKREPRWTRAGMKVVPVSCKHLTHESCLNIDFATLKGFQLISTHPFLSSERLLVIIKITHSIC